jgi:hypothetical protein
MTPYTDIESAKAAIDAYNGTPEDFFLPISDELNDPVGINMAILVDVVLSKDWEPNGFEQKSGFRIYRYKALS